jgi:hypothetical protein
MNENATQEGLLVRAGQISQRMVDVVRLGDYALLLDAKYEWAGAIYAVLVEKGIKVKEIRKQTTAEHGLRLLAALPT